jgi:hypothetical protein
VRYSGIVTDATRKILDNTSNKSLGLRGCLVLVVKKAFFSVEQMDTISYLNDYLTLSSRSSSK